MRVISGFTMPPYTNIYTNILHRNTQWFIYSRANPNKSEIFLFYHTIHHTHILALLQPHDRISDENVKTNGNNGPEKHKSHNRGATFVRITSASPYSHIYWDWFTTLPQSQRCRCADLCSGGQISPSCSHMHASFPYAVLGWCQTLCRDGGLIRHEGPCHSTNQHRWDFCSFSVTGSAQQSSICAASRFIGDWRALLGHRLFTARIPRRWRPQPLDASGEDTNRERGGFWECHKVGSVWLRQLWFPRRE